MDTSKMNVRSEWRMIYTDTHTHTRTYYDRLESRLIQASTQFPDYHKTFK